MQNQTKEAARQRRFFREQQVQQVFREWAMALLSPPRHGDHHGDDHGRRHAGHHDDDNGPSPPSPHSKLSFLLFDFTFGQEFHSASADSHAAHLLSSNKAATRKGFFGRVFVIYGDLQMPLWQLPRPQSLSSRHSRRVRSALATTQASYGEFSSL